MSLTGRGAAPARRAKSVGAGEVPGRSKGRRATGSATEGTPQSMEQGVNANEAMPGGRRAPKPPATAWVRDRGSPGLHAEVLRDGHARGGHVHEGGWFGSGHGAAYPGMAVLPLWFWNVRSDVGGRVLDADPVLIPPHCSERPDVATDHYHDACQARPRLEGPRRFTSTPTCSIGIARSTSVGRR